MLSESDILSSRKKIAQKEATVFVLQIFLQHKGWNCMLLLLTYFVFTDIHMETQPKKSFSHKK